MTTLQRQSTGAYTEIETTWSSSVSLEKITAAGKRSNNAIFEIEIRPYACSIVWHRPGLGFLLEGSAGKERGECWEGGGEGKRFWE